MTERSEGTPEEAPADPVEPEEPSGAIEPDAPFDPEPEPVPEPDAAPDAATEPEPSPRPNPNRSPSPGRAGEPRRRRRGSPGSGRRGRAPPARPGAHATARPDALRARGPHDRQRLEVVRRRERRDLRGHPPVRTPRWARRIPDGPAVTDTAIPSRRRQRAAGAGIGGPVRLCGPRLSPPPRFSGTIRSVAPSATPSGRPRRRPRVYP
jgi:hypothetical protein